MTQWYTSTMKDATTVVASNTHPSEMDVFLALNRFEEAGLIRSYLKDEKSQGEAALHNALRNCSFRENALKTLPL